MAEDRPSLNFYDPVSGDEISLHFGYLKQKAMMPVFSGDDLLVMIPREVLISALSEGWGNQEEGWWVQPSSN